MKDMHHFNYMICLWNLINTAPNRKSALSKIYINYYMEILFLFFWDNKLLSYIRSLSSNLSGVLIFSLIYIESMFDAVFIFFSEVSLWGNL